MINQRNFIGIFILSLVLCNSCLSSKYSSASFTRDASIKISSGKAVVKINGKVNEDLYDYNSLYNPKKEIDYYDKPAIPEGTITKDETRNMNMGEEYKFSVLPTEVVTINITSLDSDDVELIVYQYGKGKKHTVKGTDRLGIFLAFQNR
jgi:hypothetical protein